MKIDDTRLQDKWWRLNNLYWILDDDGHPVKFQCNVVQKMLFENTWWKNIILKARQLGITTFVDLYILDECLFHSNLEAAIIAHTRDDAEKIFRRKIVYPYRNLPDWLQKERKLIKDSQEGYQFSNNSIVSVTTSARSGTLQLLHISEYAKICAKYPDKAREVKTGSIPAASGKNALMWIESTAEGQGGDYYDKTKIAQNLQIQDRQLTRMDFKFWFFPWYEHPNYELSEDEAKAVVIDNKFKNYFHDLEVKTKTEIPLVRRAWYVKAHEIYGDDLKREMPSTPEEAFEQAIHGTYFASEFRKIREEGRITRIPIERGLSVHTWWDLGYNDTMAIWFAQVHGREVRCINYYENSHEGLAHYKKYLDEFKKEHDLIYGQHLAPHDIQVHELTSGESRLERALAMGIRFVPIPRVSDKMDSIEAARNLLSITWFDEERCSLGIQRLEKYRKEWNERLQAYASKPLHDENSNGADAFQTGAWGKRYLLEGSLKKRSKQKKQVSAVGWT